MTVKINDTLLINDLRRVAELLNKNTVSALEYEKHGRHGRQTLSSRFGSWNNAIKKAGLEISQRPNSSFTRLSSADLIVDLQRVANHLNPWGLVSTLNV